MNKNKTFKLIILTIMVIALILSSTHVFADNEAMDLTNSLVSGNSNANTDANNNNNNNNESLNNVTPVNNTNTSSSYDESNIPYAGPAETSILIISAFVVCAIIGIYTFIKLSDYSNI